MTETGPESLYRDRCDRFAALSRRYEGRSSRLGNLNLLLVLAAVVLAGLAVWRGGLALWISLAGVAAAFVAGFVYQDRVNQALRRYQTLLALNEEGLARLARAWDALPVPPPPAAAASRPAATSSRPAADLAPHLPDFPDSPHSPASLDAQTASDLDLLGRASLQHLLGTPNTPAGRAVLRDWILHPAPAGTARGRQAAVAELGPQIDWRDEIGAAGRLMGPPQGQGTPTLARDAQAGYERLIAWAEGGGWLRRRAWLLWVARGLTLATLGLAAAQFAGIRVLGAAILPWLGLALAGNALVILLFGRQVGHEIEEVAARQGIFAAYADIFGLVTGHSFRAPCLAALQEKLSAGGVTADVQMRRLARLMPAADLRGWMFFILIEITTLWSFHLLWLLERWQAVAGTHVRAWLAALGETEALIGLATLHHDHPAWAFPELLEAGAPGGVTLAGSDLAHPLLPPGRAVGNDVQVGPAGTFLLVTGSNMSGKSTLLRAIGANAVLAQMGGPVCAARLALPPLVLASSMRVQDSLEQGVSSYMAELRRLKAIVDLAAALRPEEVVGRTPAELRSAGAKTGSLFGEAHGPATGSGTGPATGSETGPVTGSGAARLAEKAVGDITRPYTLLYLLDEILQGTNTAERQIAARRVILHLVRSGAIGAVSTHDLTLAADREMERAAVPVHFTETFVPGTDGAGATMTFDYRLRPGIATSTNALKLMEIIGLAGE